MGEGGGGRQAGFEKRKSEWRQKNKAYTEKNGETKTKETKIPMKETEPNIAGQNLSL